MSTRSRIAVELKEFIGEKVLFLKGFIGIGSFGPVFASTIYEIKRNEENNIIIEFNEDFTKNFLNTKETKEYKKAKEFCEENNYILQLKKYDMTPPKPRPGILF